MLNKGFRFFGAGGSNRKFQVSSQKAPWPDLFSKLGIVRQIFVNQPLMFLRSKIIQMESIAKQRMRQFLWMRCFYNRFYDRNLYLRLRHPRYLVGGAILCSSQSNPSFDWEKERLSQKEYKSYFGHIDQCHDIKEKTITCKVCGNRLRIGSEVSNITYCKCKDAPSSVYGKESEDCEWKPFIERKDILVWRREHKTMKGNYEYKMYGNFDDVTADEFLSVQLDMSEFRLSWDKATAQCVVMDENKKDEDSNAIVYYWEVNWPRFFSNRDYCCYREHQVDPESGTFLVLSKSVDHPNCPSKKKTWRVQDYFSVLVIKPHTTSDKPGLEFCLTGYENPGLQLPESIITWVAVRGMPEFMMNLRAACLKLREEQQKNISMAPRKEPEPQTAKEASKVYQENSSNYQQHMSQSRMYA